MKKNIDIQAHQLPDNLTKNYGPNKKFVTICAGTGCRACGSIKVKEEFEAEIKETEHERGYPRHRVFRLL